MSKKVSVLIRNKNQKDSLKFLLKNLNNRYKEDIDEIIVIDNESTDGSIQIAEEMGAKVVTIVDFGYGSSANLAATSASHEIVVMFSAHSFPVSQDFFQIIKAKFNENDNLAGVRAVHRSGDYKLMINGVKSKDEPNLAGLMFCGSAFSKEVWRKHPFQDDIVTFEDKEWTLRVLNEGYDIEMVPAVFCYDLKRTQASNYKRFKDETLGNRDIWGKKVTIGQVFLKMGRSWFGYLKIFLIETFYVFKTGFFLLRYVLFEQSKNK